LEFKSSSGFARKVVSNGCNGYAAGCEARLCRAVTELIELRARPLVRPSA